MNHYNKASLSRYYLVTIINDFRDGFEQPSHHPIELRDTDILSIKINELLSEEWFQCDNEDINLTTDNPYTGYTFFKGTICTYLSQVVSLTEEDYKVLRKYL